MQYKKYPIYSDTGITWLGKIPKGWDVKPIKFNLLIPITDGPHETPELFEEGIPFISAEAVKNDRLDFSKKRGFISLEDHKRFSKKYKPRKDDVYMVKSGATTGNVARVDTEEEFNIWSPLAALRPDSKFITTDFIFYFMKSKPFFYSVELSWSYGTQQNIGMGVIANLKMAIPPIIEQKLITTFLNYKTTQIDKLIEKKKALIEKLNKKRIALITKSVTKGLDETAPRKDSGVDWLGEVPRHWSIKRLKFCVDIISIKIDAKDTDLNYLGLENIESFTGKKLLNQNGNTESEGIGSLYFTNDVLFGKLRPYLAKAYLAEEKGICTTEFIVMRSNSIIPNFLLYWVLSENFISIVNSSTYGTKMPRANWEYIGNSPFLVPPKNEQEKISSYIDDEINKIDNMIKLNNKTIDRLEEYRTAIITAAVMGKIDVRNINNMKDSS